LRDFELSPPKVLFYNLCGDPEVVAAIKAWTEAEGILSTEGGEDNTPSFFGGGFTSEEIDRIRHRLGTTSPIVEEVIMFALCGDTTAFKGWLKDKGVRVYHEALEQPEGFYVAYYRPEDIETISVEYMGCIPWDKDPAVAVVSAHSVAPS
jgi:hypothetical protein